MTCFNPKYATYKYMPLPRYTIDKETKIKHYLKDKNGNTITKLGKKISFTTRAKYYKNEEEKIGEGYMIIPCGKCIGCRLDKAKTYGLRGLLESKQWKNNCFVTLTYNDEYLPKDHNLIKKDIQNFLKRLRKQYQGIESRIWKNKEEYPIRYFYSGEYGSEQYTMRPHFHLAIFNWKPDDLKFWKFNKTNDKIFLSDTIQKLWSEKQSNNTYKPMGFITVEELNFNTAQYIARYTAKKCFNNHDEIIKAKGLNPEFIETSRRGGLAYQIKEQPEQWEKMKRNYGFFYKDKKGNLKLGKIPNFLKNKWKEENDIEYFENTDKHSKQTQQAIQEQLNQTSLTIDNYLQIQKRTLIEKLKATKSLNRNRF